MKTIDRLAPLSHAELVRLRATLCRRYADQHRRGVLEIGFGQAERGGRIDPNRPDAICFYVRRKRMPRNHRQRIPRQVEVRIRRDRRYVLVRLPSDVLELDGRSMQPTGRAIRLLSTRRRATAGCIMAWRVAGRRRLGWGLLTVGHMFPRGLRLPERQSRIRLASSRAASSRDIEGTLLARSKSASQVDAAVVQVARGDLIREGLMPANISTRGKRIREPGQLVHDRGCRGFTLPVRRPVGFVVLRYLPVSDLLPQLGSLVQVLDVTSSRPGTFAPGRSGSLWLIEGQAACQQFGGWDTPGRPADSYRRGLGQSLAIILKWAHDELARLEQVPRGQVDLRLIREL